MKGQKFAKFIIVMLLGLSLAGCADGDVPSGNANKSVSSVGTNSSNQIFGPSVGQAPDPVNPPVAAPQPSPQPNPSLALVTSNASDELADWPSANVRDNNPSSCYSSRSRPANYTDGISLAAWTEGPVTVSSIRLQARMVNGQVQAFPRVIVCF